ncbi:hypothetical protein L7F22_046051 [Adiantum nelumboides]|nr:hypothetical protein [Adiantum nelumboides]
MKTAHDTKTAAIVASVLWLLVMVCPFSKGQAQLLPQPFGQQYRRNAKLTPLRMPTRPDDEAVLQWRKGQAQLLPQPFGQQYQHNAKLTPLHMPTRPDDEAVLQWRNDGQQAQLISCHNDADICRDPLRNPGGGSTCCWNRVCKDTENDDNHCGKCGQPCGIGLRCCGASCVNLLWDNFNCGCCGHRCADSQCAFGMCGYAE